MRAPWFILWLLFRGAVFAGAAEGRALLEEPVHLGAAGQPEWSIFEGRTPSAEALRLEFEAEPNRTEQALFIRQSDVKQNWAVELNGQRLGTLHLMEADLVHALAVPPGALKSGANELRISTRSPEDIVLHQITLAPESAAEMLSGILRAGVRDESGQLTPARITVVDRQGFLVPLRPAGEEPLAVRPGVIYTGTGLAEVNLPPGEYTVFATRGPEYTLAAKKVTVPAEGEAEASLRIRRAVPTPGWIAADTHLHTLTFSGHGDALLRERMLTIAGEAIELPVCTEHNRHEDYQDAANEAGVAQYFTPVPGNEVTTRRGHFNIFPVKPGAPPPDWKIEHWPDLIERLRATPGVQVVVLNHPQDTHGGFTPFSPANLNPLTGKNARGFEFSFDAMEIINSGAMRSDWMEPVRSWFALLNRGLRITGVAASDSHDVSRFIAGQGRTYIQADDSDPGAIDIGQACANLLAGRAVASLGLFLDFSVNGSGPGELARGRGKAQARVLGASWVSANKVAVYANGILWRETAVSNPGPGPVKAELKWDLPPRTQDYFLVAIASGPGVTHPAWAAARPYQPSSIYWDPVSLAISNPVWVDADEDGKFTAAREYARQLIDEQPEPAALLSALAAYDAPVAWHAAESLFEESVDILGADFQRHLSLAPFSVREAFDQYRATLKSSNP